MQFSGVLLLFAALVVFECAANRGPQCTREEVHCRDSNSCVSRAWFSCGDKSCGQYKKLCGPPHVMNCVSIQEDCPQPPDARDDGASGDGARDEDDGASRGGARDNRDRSQDRDDNPFSRGSQDGPGYDFDRDEAESRLNDSKVRSMMRQHFDRSVLEDLIGSERPKDESSDDKKDRCAGRYFPCVKTFLKKLAFLDALGGPCRRMIREPERFAQQLLNRRLNPNPLGEECSSGHKFCPLTLGFKNNGCIPKRKNCSCAHDFGPDERNSTDEHYTPWGKKCQKGFRFESFVMACIPKRNKSSCQLLSQWMKEQNASGRNPLGKVCPRGTKFCVSSMKCEPKTPGCGTAKLIRWASKVLCNSSQRLCPGFGIDCRSKDEACPREVNVTKDLREAAQAIADSGTREEVLRNLSRSGWTPICKLKKILVSRFLHGLKSCLSRKADCRAKGYESHKRCLNGEGFCQDLKGVARDMSSEIHRLCGVLKRNASEFERVVRRIRNKKPWGGNCSAGKVFCPPAMGCVRRDNLANCSTKMQFFREGLQKAPWNDNRTDNRTDAGGKKFCILSMGAAPNGKCSIKTWLDWQARNDRRVTPFGDRCPDGRNFTLRWMECLSSEERQRREAEVNQVNCSDDSRFCEKQQVCLPKQPYTCANPSRFDFFSVSQFANETGWAALCQVRIPLAARFEQGLRKCRQFLARPNGTCSAQTSCPGNRQFCHSLGRCVARGNCSRRPDRPDHIRPTRSRTTPPATRVDPGSSPHCDSSAPELLMLWPNEPLKKLFAPERAPQLLSLFNVSHGAGDLLYKLGDGSWEKYERCSSGKVRVLSTDTLLRVSSCVHGFLSFNIVSAPPSPAHGLCVNPPDEPAIQDTVAMVLLPSLDKLAADLDITVINPNISAREDHPTTPDQISNYVNVTSSARVCRERMLDRSIACRVSQKFRERYRQALRQKNGKRLGVAIKEIVPPRKFMVKCELGDRGFVEIRPSSFFGLERSCRIHPAENVFGTFIIKLVPALQIPAEQALDFKDAMKTLGLSRPRDYERFPQMIKTDKVEQVIAELNRLLNSANDRKKKRNIRNIVRCFISNIKSQSCKSSPNSECFLGKNETQLTVIIQGENDRPRFAQSDVYPFPPVPENVADPPAKCVNVSRLTAFSPKYMATLIKKNEGDRVLERMAEGLGRPSDSLVQDDDGDVTGLAVVAVSNPWFGTWRFKKSREASQEIELTDGTVLLLKPEDCLMFDANNTAFWDRTASQEDTKLSLRAWDCSDGRQSGYHQLNASYMNSQTSFSRRAIDTIVYKLGCDKRPGSMLRRDQCGQCPVRGNKRKCLGCDQRPNSNKTLDECGNCLAPHERRQGCTGSCLIPSYRDECGQCQSNGSEVNFKDCNGVCNGHAKWSDCAPDVCVGGTTDLSPDYGKDACGDCGARNKCVDCDGVLRGTKKLDSCDRCLEPEDEAFDRCLKIQQASPTTLFKNRIMLTLKCAGLKKTARCSLSNGDTSYTLVLKRIEPRKKIIIIGTDERLDAGEYTLKCFFDENTEEIEYTLDKIHVYDRPTILEVRPNETAVNTAADVVLVGSGFVNSTTLTCVIFNIRRRVFQKLNAEFVSDRRIKCRLPPNLPPLEFKISLMFAPEHEEMAKSLAKDFSIYHVVPRPVECRFSGSYRSIFIRFDGPVECSKKKPSCGDFFKPSTLRKFGSKPLCLCKNNGLMVVFLKLDFTLQAGDSAEVKLRDIRWKSAHTKHQAASDEAAVDVLGSRETAEFKLELTGPRKVGLCDPIVLSVTPNRRIAFNWSAAFVDPSSPAITPQITAVLQQLNDGLANLRANQSRLKLRKDDLHVDVTFNITVCGRNDFGGQVACDSHTITLVGEKVPQIIFAKDEISISPRAAFKLRAIVKASSCLRRNMRQLYFLWACDVPGFEFENENPTPRISPDRWSAGRTYTFTLTVYMKHDRQQFSRASLIMKIRSERLRAKIKGGKSRTLSVDDEAVCDASDSEDPNNLLDDPIYVWTCKCKEDGRWLPCFYKNRTTARSERLVLPQSARVRIPPRTLPANKMCAITLTYVKGHMNDSTSVVFNVKAGSIPDVKILKAKRVNANEKVVMVAIVKSSLPYLNLEWTCKQEDEEGNLTDVDLEATELLLTRTVVTVYRPERKLSIRKRESLVFRQFPDGMKLKCKLSVSHEEVSAFAEGDLEVNEPPTKGSVEVSSEDDKYTFTAVGFEDKPEDGPLTYQCGCKQGKKNRLLFYTSPSTSESCEDMSLPPGDAICCMEVSDTLKAKTRVCFDISVPAHNVTPEQLSNSTDDILDDISNKNIREAIGRLKALFGSKSIGEGAEQAMRTLMENSTKKMLESSVQGEEEKSQLVDGLAENSKQAKKTGVELDKERIAKWVGKALSPDSSEGEEDSARRKRRSADAEEVQVQLKTADEVETALSIFSNTLEPRDYSNSSMVVKGELVALVPELGRSMCKGLSTGEPAVVAESEVVVIRSENNKFENIHTNFTEVACRNCSEAVQVSAQVLLGQSLKDLYEEWDCDEDACNGACVVSAQYPYDLLAAFENESSISHVVSVELFNPESLARLLVSGLAVPVTYRIPLLNYSVSSDSVPLCHSWDDLLLKWTTNDVTTSETFSDEHGNMLIDCKSTKLGFISVLAVNATDIPLTTPSTHSTQQPEQQVYIQIKLVGNYDDVINDANRSAVTATVREDLASKMDVNESRISELQFERGSILVSFILLPGGPGVNNVTLATSLLRGLVQSGNFSVTLSDGRKLFADPAWFQSSASPLTTTAPVSTPTQQSSTQQAQPSETSSGLSTGTLVGIIVGSVLGVALLIALVVIVKMRGGKTKVDDAKRSLAAPSGQSNELFHQETDSGHGPTEEKNREQYPMYDVREEAELPLPGTPDYPSKTDLKDE